MMNYNSELSKVLCSPTPWKDKAWRRQAQSSFPELPLRDAMRAVARAYVLAIPEWDGDWEEGLTLFQSRARS